MTYKLVLLFLFIGSNVYGQSKKWAVGVKLGDPTGLMIRKYSSPKKSFDFTVGTYGGFWGSDREYSKGMYRGSGISFSGQLVFHNNVQKTTDIQYYYGYGVQLNSRSYYPTLTNTAESRLTIGGNGVAGLEYFLKEVPISLFLEGSLYVELLLSPFFIHPQGGIGTRFNF